MAKRLFFFPNPLFEDVSFFSYTFLVLFSFPLPPPLFFVYEKKEVEST